MAKKTDSSRYFKAQRNYDYETNTTHGNAAMSESDWQLKVIDELKTVSQSYKQCDVVAIFHGEDRYTAADQKKYLKHVKGTLKPLHVHFVIRFGDNKSIDLVQKKFGISNVRNIQAAGKKDVFLSYRYLTHRTVGAMEQGKAPYDTSSLFFIGFNTFEDENNADNSLAWDASQKTSVYTKLCQGHVKVGNDKEDLRELERNMVGQICVSLIDGVIRADSARTHLIDLYKNAVKTNKIDIKDNSAEAVATQLYYSNQNKFKAAFNDHLKSKAADMIKHDRNLNNGYISGSGGTGKSQLAKAMALVFDAGRIPHMATADGDRTTYDPAGNYHGERVSIFNEMEGSALAMREFCNVFDPHQYVPFSSRNNDVDWVANYSVITASDSLSRWVDDKLRFGKGGKKYDSDRALYKKDSYQVLRRLDYHCDLVPSGENGCDIVAYKFNGDRTSMMPFAPINAQPYHCDDVRNVANLVPIATEIIHDLNLLADSELSKNAAAAEKAAKIQDSLAAASAKKPAEKVASVAEKSAPKEMGTIDPNELF